MTPKAGAKHEILFNRF